MAKNIKNITASIHQRILNKARETSRPFNELLQRFAIERFIYRLSKSSHAECFILKGALMFTVWGGSLTRPTRDIDLLGTTDNDPEKEKVKYPALLDYPAPELNGYTMESTIAEKFHAMIDFGLTNSRMKDFYDIWNLSRNFDFSGEVLSRAVKETLKKRQYELEKTSVEFLDTFAGDEQKNSQWKSFVEKTKLDDAPDSFANVVHAIRLFIQPIADSLAGDVKFRSIWTAPGL